jgi:predicted esterase
MSNSYNGERMSLQQNVKWLSTNTIKNFKSPLKTVANWKGQQIKNVIIGLHGFGDNAANFSSLSNEIIIDDCLWVFLQGPRFYPMGQDGAQWFPLFSDPTEERRRSEELIMQTIYNVCEQCQIASNRVFILGFSQGAAMALLCALKYKEKFCGILSLSGFLIQSHVIKKAYAGSSIDTPILVAHGTQDQVIFPAMYYETLDTLRDIGVKNLKSKIYQMGHSLCQEEIRDITKFVEEYR